MAEQHAKKRRVRLKLPTDGDAIYSNMVIITHNANEVIFDFVQVLPNDDRARIQKRIIMTPVHAKLFMNALRENMLKYEAKHGEIDSPPPQSLADQLFGAVQPAQDTDDDE